MVHTIIEKNSKISPATEEKLLIGKNSEAEQIAAGTYNMFAGMMDELELYSCVISEEKITAQDIPEIAFEDIWLENIFFPSNIAVTKFHSYFFKFSLLPQSVIHSSPVPT